MKHLSLRLSDTLKITYHLAWKMDVYQSRHIFGVPIWSNERAQNLNATIRIINYCKCRFYPSNYITDWRLLFISLVFPLTLQIRKAYRKIIGTDKGKHIFQFLAVAFTVKAFYYFSMWILQKQSIGLLRTIKNEFSKVKFSMEIHWRLPFILPLGREKFDN